MRLVDALLRNVFFQIRNHLFWFLTSILILLVSAFNPGLLKLIWVTGFIFASTRHDCIKQNILRVASWTLIFLLTYFTKLPFAIVVCSFIVASIYPKSKAIFLYPAVIAAAMPFFQVSVTTPSLITISCLLLLITLIQTISQFSRNRLYHHRLKQLLQKYTREVYGCLLNSDYFTRLYLYEYRILKAEQQIEELFHNKHLPNATDNHFKTIFIHLRNSALVRLGLEDKHLWLACRQEFTALQAALHTIFARHDISQHGLEQYENAVYALESIVQQVMIVSAKDPGVFQCFLLENEAILARLQFVRGGHVD